MYKHSDVLEAFVLRSGYTIPFDPQNALGTVENLVTAIFTEVLQTLDGETTLEGVTEEIVAEASHIARGVPQDVSRAMFAGLLSGAVFECLRRMSHENGLVVKKRETIH